MKASPPTRGDRDCDQGDGGIDPCEGGNLIRLPAGSHLPHEGKAIRKEISKPPLFAAVFHAPESDFKGFFRPVFWLVSGEQVLHIGNNSRDDSVEKTGEFWYNILVKK